MLRTEKQRIALANRVFTSPVVIAYLNGAGFKSIGALTADAAAVDVPEYEYFDLGMAVSGCLDKVLGE